MKNLIKEKYAHNLVLSATTLSSAIARLLMFTKNSNAKTKIKKEIADTLKEFEELFNISSFGYLIFGY